MSTKKLKLIKKQTYNYIWSNDAALFGNKSKFHFFKAGSSFESENIEKFVSPLSYNNIINFSHTFDEYFRTDIEPYFRIRDIFVCSNQLHGRPGIGFFLLLDNDTIYHTRCGCEHPVRDNYVP